MEGLFEGIEKGQTLSLDLSGTDGHCISESEDSLSQIGPQTQCFCKECNLLVHVQSTSDLDEEAPTRRI